METLFEATLCKRDEGHTLKVLFMRQRMKFIVSHCYFTKNDHDRTRIHFGSSDRRKLLATCRVVETLG